MQIGRPKFPLNLTFDQLGTRGLITSPQKQLKSLLSSSARPADFQLNQQRLSAAARFGVYSESRSGLYREVADKLSDLGASMDLKSLTRTTTETEAAREAGPTSVLSSGEALNIGTASAIMIRANGKLADQPFLTPITGGNLDLQFSVNGQTFNRTITVDPNTDSLQDVIDDFNALRDDSGNPFMTARWDSGTGSVVFDMTGTGASTAGTGTVVRMEQLGSTSTNFLTAIASDSGSASASAIGDPITFGGHNQGRQYQYSDLRITYNGVSLDLTGLNTTTGDDVGLSGAAKTAYNKDVNRRTNELVGLIQGKIDAYNASAAPGTTIDLTVRNAGGRLAFETSSPTPEIDIQIKELGGSDSSGLGVGLKITLGFESTTTRVTAHLEAKPAIDPNFVPTIVGPDASLADLAGQLGLTPGANGTYTVTLNDERLEFQESESLLDVLAAINRSEADVEASYDALGQRVILRARNEGEQAIDAQDVDGNLLAALKLTDELGLQSLGAPKSGAERTTSWTEVSVEGVESLQALGNRLAEVHGLLSAATAPSGPFNDDPLLTDLRDAIGGLFLQGPGDALSSLGSLGLSLGEGGEATLDTERLNSLLSERPEEVAAFLDGFMADKVRPLASAGTHAIEDALANAPFEQRLAAQAVHVRGEMSRMQSRQMMVLMSQVQLSEQQEAMRKQDEKLKETERSLLGKPKEQEEEPTALAPTREPAPPAVPTPPRGIGAAIGTAAPAGLLSFGLSS